MQAIPLPLILVGALFVMGLIWYFFLEKPSKEVETRMRSLHFDEAKFILDMKTATFEYYDKRLTNVGLLLILTLAAAIAAPAMILPWPFSGLTSLFAVVCALLFIIIINQNMKEKEREEATNRAFGYMLAFHANYGFLPLLLRRMKFESEVTLEEPQRETIVKKFMDVYKTMPESKDLDVTAEEVEKAIEERLNKAHYYRLRVSEHYRLLFITETNYEDLKTHETHRIIDRTIEVNVPLIPSYSIFAGKTERTFKTKSKSGEIEYTDRTMGIYVDVMNLSTMRTKLVEDSFTSPDKLTALVGQLVHLYEQQQWTGDEMTKETRKRERAELTSQTEKFNAKAEASDIVNTTKHILKLLLALLQPATRTRQDFALLFLVFTLGMAFMTFVLWASGRLI